MDSDPAFWFGLKRLAELLLVTDVPDVFLRG